MIRQLGQSLALVAMMASVINARCAISCSLQSIARSSTVQVSRVDPYRPGHACCPHQGVPKSNQQKDEIPCPHPVTVAAEAFPHTGNGSFNLIRDVGAVGLSHEYRPQLIATYFDPVASPDSSGPRRLSSISILRI